MRHVAESALFIVIVVVAIILKEAAEIHIKYIAVAGPVVLLAYSLHLFVQYKGGSLVTRRFPWLYSLHGPPQSVFAVESRAHGNSNIYLVTPDLFNDARDSTTQDTVRANLKRGVTYHYITRDDNYEAQACIMQVLHTFSDYESQVRVYPINDLFGLIPTFNILVVEQDQNDKLRTFVELPVTEEARRRWWVEADKAIGMHWHRLVLQLVQKRKPMMYPSKEASLA